MGLTQSNLDEEGGHQQSCALTNVWVWFEWVPPKVHVLDRNNDTFDGGAWQEEDN